MHASLSKPPRWSPWWAVALAAFVLLQALLMAATTAPGLPPDEWAHLSYVRDVADGRPVPDYADGRIRGSTQGNYLSHPPLYYSLLGAATAVAGLDPFTGLRPLRMASAGFVGIGFLLWLLVGRALGLPLAGAVLVTVATCATPMFGYAAGSVNNDSLMYLGMALFAAGLVRERIDHRRDATAATALAGGALLVLLTKATGATFLALFMLALLPRAPRELWAQLRQRRHLAIGGVVAVACIAWFGWAILAYGSPLPRPQALYPHNPPADPLAPAGYAMRYAAIMWERLPIVMSHATFDPFVWRGRAFFLALVVAPLLAWLVARPGAARRGIDPRVIRGTDALALAAMGTVLIHIGFTWNSYRGSGLLAGMQPRYFAFLLPAIWLPAFLLESRPHPRRWFVAAMAALSLVAFWTSVPNTVAGQARAAERAAAATAAAAASQATRATTPAQGLRGHLDDFRIEGATLHLRGWAFDAGAGVPATVRVHVVEGEGQRVATGRIRPDVGKAMGHPAAAGSGFEASVETGAPGPRECAIGVSATAGDGRVLWLRRPSCPNAAVP